MLAEDVATVSVSRETGTLLDFSAPLLSFGTKGLLV